MKTTVGGILIAGGADQKIRGGADSAFLSAGSLPALVRSMQALEHCPEVGGFVVVAEAERYGIVRAMAARYACGKMKGVAPAAATRLACLASGLEAFPDPVDWVVIHEASRPFTRPAGITAVIQAAIKAKGSAATGFRIQPTVRTGPRGKASRGIAAGSGLWTVATPIVCPFKALQKAVAKLRKTKSKNALVDETELMDLLKLPVVLVECEETNLRIQCADDLVVAAHLLG